MSAALALAGAAASAETPKPFDPVDFFTGPTRGEGELKELLGKAKRTQTVSVGRVDKDGWLLLEQKVMVEGDPVRHRRWRLKEMAPGKFGGTLSDAKSPVVAEVTAQSARIQYRMKGNLKVEQVLTPLPGGRALENRATFSKWGMRVAVLTERIEKR